MHSAKVVQEVPAPPVPESSLADVGHAPFCCTPLEETFDGPPPSESDGPPEKDDSLHAKPIAVSAAMPLIRKTRLRMRHVA